MDLITQLVQQLGVKEDQAKAGAGLLFKTAQEKLNASDFSQVSKFLPQVGSLISAAPQSNDGGIMKVVGAVTGMLGGKASNLGELAKLAGSFSKIGLNADMVSKFAGVIFSSLKQQGGSQIVDILQKILK